MSFCGGGTTSFRSWTHCLPEDVELVLYCYPGREGRFTTPFARDWDELLSDALAAVRDIAWRPYVLFGHSMGAWVAFDLARRAECEGIAPPRALVVSAADAPTRRQESAKSPPTVHDSDEQLVAWMRTNGQLPAGVQEDPEILQIAVEILRADMRVMDTYRYRSGERIGVPIQVLLGKDDDADAGVPDRWRRLGTTGVEAAWLPGGHFYTPDVWSRLPDHMTALHPARSGTTPEQVVAQTPGTGQATSNFTSRTYEPTRPTLSRPEGEATAGQTTVGWGTT
ncbi:alpha/beta fold hydrolase [Streptomyces sp. SCA3-4]|nr:alpha/beta fold hydrolase [Streptomyces sichuanensis]